MEILKENLISVITLVIVVISYIYLWWSLRRKEKLIYDITEQVIRDVEYKIKRSLGKFSYGDCVKLIECPNLYQGRYARVVSVDAESDRYLVEFDGISKPKWFHGRELYLYR